jgi:hypothetical protein
VMLGEAPGGPQFINSLLEAIKDFSLLYSGTPEDRARPHLESYLSSIEPAIIEAVGARNAPILLDGFRHAVFTRKHEIEAQGASRA